MDHIERLAATVIGDGLDDIDGVIAVLSVLPNLAISSALSKSGASIGSAAR